MYRPLNRSTRSIYHVVRRTCGGMPWRHRSRACRKASTGPVRRCKLLWQQNPPPWMPGEHRPRVRRLAGRAGRLARDRLPLRRVPPHVRPRSSTGPDATRLLSAVSANNYENFAVGQAKQFVPVTAQRRHRHRRHPAARGREQVRADRHPRRAALGPVPRREGRLRRRLHEDPSSAFRGGGDPGSSATRYRDRTRGRWSRRCSAGRCRRPSSSTPSRSVWTAGRLAGAAAQHGRPGRLRVHRRLGRRRGGQGDAS